MYGMSIYVIDRSIHHIDTDWWKKIAAKFLKPGRNFEIRCWKEESDTIEQALCYGTLNLEDSNKAYETSIKGTLTKQMIHDILEAPKPQDDEMMTEFFTINVEPRFFAAHTTVRSCTCFICPGRSLRTSRKFCSLFGTVSVLIFEVWNSHPFSSRITRRSWI